MTISELTAVAALAGNAVAIVWGAAKLTSSVKQLEKTSDVMQGSLDKITLLVNGLALDVGIMKAKDAIIHFHRRASDEPSEELNG